MQYLNEFVMSRDFKIKLVSKILDCDSRKPGPKKAFLLHISQQLVNTISHMFMHITLPARKNNIL